MFFKLKFEIFSLFLLSFINNNIFMFESKMRIDTLSLEKKFQDQIAAKEELKQAEKNLRNCLKTRKSSKIFFLIIGFLFFCLTIKLNQYYSNNDDKMNSILPPRKELTNYEILKGIPRNIFRIIWCSIMNPRYLTKKPENCLGKFRV